MAETMQQLHDAQQIADHVYRLLQQNMQYPEFGKGGVPIEVAAEVYGKSVVWIREGISQGWLPIGYASENGTRRNFYISPKKLWEDTGYIYRGVDDDKTNEES